MTSRSTAAAMAAGLVFLAGVSAAVAPRSPARQSAVTVTDGQAGQTVALPAAKRAAVAPQPAGWAARVTMKGCGQAVTATVRAGRTLLVVNGGTLPRYRLAWPAGFPGFSGAWVPSDWRAFTFNVAGVYTLSWRTSYCTKPAPRLTLIVRPP